MGFCKKLKSIFCFCSPGFTAVKVFAAMSFIAGAYIACLSSWVLGVAVDNDEDLRKYNMGKRASVVGICFGFLQFSLSLKFFFAPPNKFEFWLKLWMLCQIILIFIFSGFSIYFWTVQKFENPFHQFYHFLYVIALCVSIIFVWVAAAFCATLHSSTSDESMRGENRSDGGFLCCLPRCCYFQSQTVKKIATIAVIFQVIFLAVSSGCIAPLESVTVKPILKKLAPDSSWILDTEILDEHRYSILGNKNVFCQIVVTWLLLAVPSAIAKWRLVLLVLIQGVSTFDLIDNFISLYESTTSGYRWVFFIFYGVDIVFMFYLIWTSVVIIFSGCCGRCSRTDHAPGEDISLN